VEKRISIIIPNYQGASTLANCLAAAFASDYQNFEVVVVDDASEDNSVEIIKGFPCKLVQMEQHGGASQARNIGAANSDGELLFFTDADCLLQKDTLSIVSQAMDRLSASAEGDFVLGGSYTHLPFDKHFFSQFQSVFVHYSETRHQQNPDYLATHAMVIETQSFLKSGGFNEHFLPILEDVEFSHRLRKAGYRLLMNPAIQVQHIFNFSLYRSLRNAIRKSMYWTVYSLKNNDVLADSGTASLGLKTNVICWFLIALLLLVFILTGYYAFMVFIPLLLAINLFVNKGLVLAFYRSKGVRFAFAATAYYLLLYPLAVGFGALAGLARYITTQHTLRESS